MTTMEQFLKYPLQESQKPEQRPAFLQKQNSLIKTSRLFYWLFELEVLHSREYHEISWTGIALPEEFLDFVRPNLESMLVVACARHSADSISTCTCP